MRVKYCKTQGPAGEHPNGNGSDTDAQQWANYLFGMFYQKCSNTTYTNSDDDYYKNGI